MLVTIRSNLLPASSGRGATIKLPNIMKSSLLILISLHIMIAKKAVAKFLAGQGTEQPLLESLYNVNNVDSRYRDEDE